MEGFSLVPARGRRGRFSGELLQYEDGRGIVEVIAERPPRCPRRSEQPFPLCQQREAEEETLRARQHIEVRAVGFWNGRAHERDVCDAFRKARAQGGRQDPAE
jgi:hypothetical protein